MYFMSCEVEVQNANMTYKESHNVQEVGSRQSTDQYIKLIELSAERNTLPEVHDAISEDHLYDSTCLPHLEGSYGRQKKDENIEQ